MSLKILTIKVSDGASIPYYQFNHDKGFEIGQFTRQLGSAVCTKETAIPFVRARDHQWGNFQHLETNCSTPKNGPICLMILHNLRVYKS